MSYPFGGHPKFGHFKAWAESEGIEVKNGIMEIEGISFKITTFITAEGVKVPVTDILDGEFLVPTLVARLERRLGILSPFPSILGTEN